MIRVLALLGLLLGTGVAEDPYETWAQGRPAEALPTLIAQAGDHWDRWQDAGLAAAAAGDQGRAVACLARAMTLAPEEADPRRALRALGVECPPSWHERAGPLGLPGRGWSGVVLLALAGVALGWAAVGRRHRRSAGFLGAALVVVILPGQLASVVDGQHHWAATVRPTHLLDHAGVPLAPLAAGTLLRLPDRAGWSGRVVVALPDGREGFLAAADVNP